MSSDLLLLQRYHRDGDAAAFRELAAAHAGMVFATARRVTRDPALAEDVAQETFLELARHAPTITESVGAWLHRVATRRAYNLMRNLATRRRNEEAAASLSVGREEATWEELEPLIDEALEELPDNLREPVLEHYLGGRTQQEVATKLGVNQSTVSRLLERGVEELRAALRRRDVIAGAALALYLTQDAKAASASPHLLDVLAKRVAEGTHPLPVVQTATPAAAGWKAIALAAGVAVALGSIFLVVRKRARPADEPPASVTAGTTAESPLSVANAQPPAIATPPAETWPQVLPAGAELQVAASLTESVGPGGARTLTAPLVNVAVGASANVVTGDRRLVVIPTAQADGNVGLRVRLFEASAAADEPPIAEFTLATPLDTSTEVKDGAFALTVTVTRRPELEGPSMTKPGAAPTSWDP